MLNLESTIELVLFCLFVCFFFFFGKRMGSLIFFKALDLEYPQI